MSDDNEDSGSWGNYGSFGSASYTPAISSPYETIDTPAPSWGNYGSFGQASYTPSEPLIPSEPQSSFGAGFSAALDPVGYSQGSTTSPPIFGSEMDNPSSQRGPGYSNQTSGSLPVSQQDYLRNSATQAGIDPLNLTRAMMLESAKTMSPDIMGGKGDNYQGLIQFGPEERSKYGVYQGMPFEDQIDSSIKFLQDRGLKPGDSLTHLYSTINAGSPGPKYWNRSDGNGTVLDKATELSGPQWTGLANSWLNKSTFSNNPNYITLDSVPQVPYSVQANTSPTMPFGGLGNSSPIQIAENNPTMPFGGLGESTFTPSQTVDTSPSYPAGGNQYNMPATPLSPAAQTALTILAGPMAPQIAENVRNTPNNAGTQSMMDALLNQKSNSNSFSSPQVASSTPFDFNTLLKQAQGSSDRTASLKQLLTLLGTPKTSFG